MAGQMIGSLDTQQLGPLADIQLDYYGKRAAAASGDIIQVWDITDGQQRPAGTMKGHEGPVWKVSWAHPKFGSLLASCSYDMKVIVWKEMPPSSTQWQMAYVDTSHSASVNDAEFCPYEHGLRLGCASSDGTVSILTHSGADQQWRRASFAAHPGGAQTLSWAPVQRRDGVPVSSMRLATGGCDNSVSIWKCEGDAWVQEMPPLPPAHTDWVRAVAWRPGEGTSVVASGSWDRTVVVWAQEVEGQPWRQACRIQVAGKVEGLSWSVTGSILAVSFADTETTLYKEAYDGHYEEVGKVGEQGFTEIASKTAPPSVQNGFENSDVTSPQVSQVGQPPQAPANDAAAAALAAQQQNVLAAFGM